MASQAPDFRAILSSLREGKSFIVWWYGDVVLRDGRQPQVNVLFREGTSAKTVITVPINLTYLNFFPLGSVWANSRHVGEADFLIKKAFETSFDVANYEQKLVTDVGLLTKEPYLAAWGEVSDRSSIHIFKTTNDETIIIPSQLIFNKLYGFNAELRKRIVTSPIETLLRDCYEKIIPEPPADGHWHIALPRTMRDSDIVQLASMKYDSFARKQVASIHASLQKFSPSKMRNFIHASPWWQGEATLKVYGLYLDEKTFLVLRVVGSSWPDDNIIDRIRYRTSKHSKNAESRGELKPIKRHEIEKDTVEIADVASPDRDSPTTKLFDSDFYFLNEVEIRKIVADQEGVPSKKGSEEEPSMFASGDGSGTGTGAGKLAVTTNLEAEKAEGALSGIWEELKRCLSDGSAKRLYLTTIDGYIKSEDVEKLSVISFVPLVTEKYRLNKHWDNLTEEQQNRVKNWVYLNKIKGELRGLLSIKVIMSCGSIIHILEIQRKIIGSKEESFRGFAFTLHDEKDFQEEIKRLMDIMNYNCGVIGIDDMKLLKGYTYRYNHSKPRKEEKKNRPYELVVTRILKRFGKKDE